MLGGTNQIVLFMTLSAPSQNYKKKDDVMIVYMSRGLVSQKRNIDQVVSTISNLKNFIVF